MSSDPSIFDYFIACFIQLSVYLEVIFRVIFRRKIQIFGHLHKAFHHPSKSYAWTVGNPTQMNSRWWVNNVICIFEGVCAEFCSYWSRVLCITNLLIFKAEILACFCHGCNKIHHKNHNIISFSPWFNAAEGASSNSEVTNLLFRHTCMQNGLWRWLILLHNTLESSLFQWNRCID